MKVKTGAEVLLLDKILNSKFQRGLRHSALNIKKIAMNYSIIRITERFILAIKVETFAKDRSVIKEM